jgi:shikimate dehydrogenase
MTAAWVPRRDIVGQAVRECLAAEVPGIAVTTASDEGTAAASSPAPDRGTAALAGIGTISAHALASPMLARALAAEGLGIATQQAFDGPASLLAADGWELALVLSPWKRSLTDAGLALSPSATATGVVDTALAVHGERIGINTNSWAAAAALAAIISPGSGVSVLLLGAGGSARSTAFGVRRRWPGARLAVCARDVDAAASLAATFGADTVPLDHAPEVQPDVIINATTWGETESSQNTPFAFPFSRLLAPGRVFFDLNNRRSALQEEALGNACIVMSGTLMQVITHACRAALARAVKDGKRIA